MTVRLSLALAALVLTFSHTARAQEESLFLESLDGRTVRVDGLLRDWQGVPLRALGASSTSSMRYALGADARGVYLAADVRDDRVVRTARAGAADDAIVLTLVSPTARGTTSSDVWIFPGIEGERAAEVQIGSRVRAARVVEARTENGYTLEAFVPWDAIPGASDWQRGRGRIRLHDVDAGGSAAELASTSRTEPATLPLLDSGFGELAVLKMFLRDRRLAREAITHDLRVDVAGDATPERIVVAGPFFAIFGLGYLEGTGYDFASVGTLVAPGMTRVEPIDFTGDGKPELFVSAWVSRNGADHHAVRVYGFAATRVVPLLQTEVAYRSGRATIDGTASTETSRGKLPALRVAVGESQGVDGSRFVDPPPAGVVPMLVPWGDVAKRTYRYDGHDFAVASEEPIVRQAVAAAPAPRPAAPPARTATTPAPRAPAYSRAAIVDLLRRDRSVAATVRERFALRADVAEDARTEEVFVLDKGVAIVGEGFQRGERYFYVGLAVATADDVLSLATGDVTGDGKHEILVRVRQGVGAGRAELLLVYALDGSGARPVLVARVGYSDGSRSIANEARLAGRGNAVELVVVPGRARGFTAESWPFADAAEPGVEPLLLPWRDREKRYRWNGRGLVRR